MFQLTESDLNSIVEKTGFSKNLLEKEYRIVDILDTLNENPAMRDKFVLKGGSALNLFNFEIPRLSIDIDLNYIAALSKDKMQEDRMLINYEIEKMFSSEYKVESTKDVHALTQFVLHYRTLSGSNDMIKLEINYLFRQPVISPVLEKCKLLGVDLNFLCLSFEELLAGKIVALLSRYTPRDLFDVYQISGSSYKINFRKLRQLILYYGLIARSSIFELFQFKFENITQSDINRKLSPMLPKRTFYKIEDLKEAAIRFLEPLIAYSDKEKAIIQSFYDTGELDANTLFSFKEIIENVRKSPVFIWKKQNIQKYLNKIEG